MLKIGEEMGGTTMLAAQRRHQIMIELQRAGQVRTNQLSEMFDVSEVTIRSDLELLQTKRQLIRSHGGALALNEDSPAAVFEERVRHNFEAKRRIAQLAVQEILDDQSIVLDSGSTLLQVAMQIPPLKNVVVATPAMNIAQHLMSRPGLDVHMIGGRVFPGTVSTIVSEAANMVGGIVAHQVFVSAHAIDPSFDVVDQSVDIAKTKRNLIQMARRVVLVADSSKWDIAGPSKAFSLSQVDLVITDSGLPYSVRRRLDKLGVEVQYA